METKKKSKIKKNNRTNLKMCRKDEEEEKNHDELDIIENKLMIYVNRNKKMEIGKRENRKNKKKTPNKK